jgi:predicted RNA-binding protein YlqC (UPF0109 family)
MLNHDPDPKQAVATQLKTLTEYMVRAVVDNPDQVQVEDVGDAALIFLELRVASSDIGRVIGKKGRIINAMRTLLRASAAQAGQRVRLEIDES